MMGLYLNPGNRSMRMDRNSSIYVDKSGLLVALNARVNRGGERYVCSSRPRRFGKTMAANMLCAYYQRGIDSHALFDDLSVARTTDYAKHLNAYDVVWLDIRQLLSAATSASNLPRYVTSKIVGELAVAYPDCVDQDCPTLFEAFSHVIAADPAHPGFIFVIDEWDALFREVPYDHAAQEAYIGFLRDMLKDKPYVALAYMTGILPIKKYGTHSVLNMFQEASMTDPEPLQEYIGFTQSEVESLCCEWGRDFSDIRSWYDGYLLHGSHVYNPCSVVSAMMQGTIKSFWSSTESYEALRPYIDLDLEGLRQDVVAMLGGQRVRVEVGGFANDMVTMRDRNDVLTLLIHLGYLAYDAQTAEAFVPNEEIHKEFENALRKSHHPELAKLVLDSDALLQATLDGNASAVARALQQAHSSAAAPLFYNNEQALRAAVKLAYISAIDEYATVEELASGRGYADLVYLPKRGSALPALLIELKWNKPVCAAIEQIKHRDYPAVLRHWHGEIVLVGVSYDEKTGEHEALIERVEVPLN